MSLFAPGVDLEVFYSHKGLFGTWAEAYVIPVNCVGVAGAGLAKEFKDKFPERFYKLYAYACNDGKIAPGKVFCTKTGLHIPEKLVFFPTKRHWRDKSTLEDVEAGLIDLIRIIEEFNLGTIAIPKLGCGLGGLEWKDVHWLICNTLRNTDVRVVLALNEEKG